MERDNLSEALLSLDVRIKHLEDLVQNRVKLHFSTRSGFLLIHPDEIMYIEAASNYSEIFLNHKVREVVSMSIGAIEEMLPSNFIRISRSLIINSFYLVKLSGVARKCYLRKDNFEISFSIPEKQLPEIKRKILKV